MPKGPQGQPADRALADFREHGIAQLVEALRHHPCDAIRDDECQRHRDHGVRGRERVHGPLVEDRYVNIDALAGEQEGDREHDARPQFEGISGPEIGCERLERAQLVPQPALLPRRTEQRRWAPARAHREASASAASLAAPGPLISFTATKRATATSTAPQKKAASRPNSPKKNPAATGPRTRDRLPTDCETPITSPCSSRPARREIRLLSEGCIKPMPSASAVTASVSRARPWANGKTRRPAPISARPHSSSRSSPNRPVRRPIIPPCKVAEMRPT